MLNKSESSPDVSEFLVAILPFAMYGMIRLVIFYIYSDWAWNSVVTWWNPAFIAPPIPNQMGDIGVYSSYEHFMDDYIEGLAVDGMGPRQRFQLMIIQEYEHLLDLFAVKIFGYFSIPYICYIIIQTAI